MPRCQICGLQCNGKTIINDQRFNVQKGQAIVCNPCFDDWLNEDYVKLYKKIEEKLKVIRLTEKVKK